jgi:hypothetical protein
LLLLVEQVAVVGKVAVVVLVVIEHRQEHPVQILQQKPYLAPYLELVTQLP